MWPNSPRWHLQNWNRAKILMPLIIFQHYKSSMRCLDQQKSVLCKNMLFYTVLCFRWLGKQNYGDVSCQKICFSWLMNSCGVFLSYRKIYFKTLIKIVSTLYPNVLRLQCWPFGVSATCIGFGMAKASQAAFGKQRLIATSTRVSIFYWAWYWRLEFLSFNLDNLIFL